MEESSGESWRKRYKRGLSNMAVLDDEPAGYREIQDALYEWWNGLSYVLSAIEFASERTPEKTSNRAEKVP